MSGEEGSKLGYGIEWEERDCCGKLVTIRKAFLTEGERTNFISEIVQVESFCRFTAYEQGGERFPLWSR